MPFYWYAVASYRQARSAPGNLKVEVKNINGVRHTLSVWESETAMRRYLYQGAHRKAIKAFPIIADMARTKTIGFYASDVPDWSEVHALWRRHGKVYQQPQVSKEKPANI